MPQSFINFGSSRGEVLVTQPTTNPSELNIYISTTDWFSRSVGYTPIRLRVKPQRGAVFRNEGVLTVCIGTGGIRAEQCDRTVVSIPIVAGESEASTEVIANLREVSPIAISARFNGSFLRASSGYGYPNNGSVHSCRLIFISEESSKSDGKRQAALANMARLNTWYASSDLYSKNTQADSAVVFVDVDRMPENWLVLNGITQAVISADDLLRLSSDQQRVLQDYSMAGGTLVVHRVSSLEEIVHALGLDLDRQIDTVDVRKKSAINAGSQMLSSADDDEVKVVPEDFYSDLDLIDDSYWDRFSRIAIRNAFTPTYLRDSTSWSQSLDVPEDVMDWFEKRAYELGKISIALVDLEWTPIQKTALELYPASSMTLPVQTQGAEKKLALPVNVLHGFGIVRLQPTAQRDSEVVSSIAFGQVAPSVNRAERFHGGIGDDFWEWLIPSVGRTPVIPFLLFVATFVGGVVPVIVFWCNRHKRRIWMVIAMPLMAALFTCLLFAYGIFKDGLGSVARIRSLTFLGTNQRGIAWSRQAYFAARIPDDGVVLSETTQVTSMTPYGSQSEGGDVQQTTFDKKQQYFNLLPPRTQKQLAIVHPVHDLKLFDVGESKPSQTDGLSLKNIASFDWEHALFIDADENFYEATSVQSGSTPILTKVTKDEAANHLRKVHLKNPLQAPPDAPSGEQLSLNETLSQIFSYNRTRTFAQDVVSEEVFWRRSIGITTSLAGTNVDMPAFRFLPNTFIIYASEAPYLEKCLPGAREEQGLHAIMGSWNKNVTSP